MLATIASADAAVVLLVGGCHPSSMGSLSFSNKYLMSVAFPFPVVKSPKDDRAREYSRSDPVLPKVALNSGLLASPYAKRALRSAAATSNCRMVD